MKSILYNAMLMYYDTIRKLKILYDQPFTASLHIALDRYHLCVRTLYSSRADGLVAQTEPIKAKVPNLIQDYVVFAFVFVVNCLHSF